MKELTIEQKAKAYDDAIEKASVWHQQCLEGNNLSRAKRLEDLFSELKESKDKRISKAIIDFIKDNHAIYANTKEQNSWISWLEKQGEQKPTDTKNLETAISNILKVYSHIILHRSLTQDELNETDVYAAENTKKLLCFLEQKSAEWSEEDERNIKELLYLVEANYLSSEEPHDRLINFLKSLLKDRVQLQPKLKKEWSKEEEKMLDEMYEFFDKHKIPSLKHDMNDYVKFIKSLKDRIQPQPKQEWNEEDKNMLQSILDEYKSMPIEKRNWLKSLRPQPQWKPSEEMLEALYRVIPKKVFKTSKEEILLDELYQGLKYGKVLSEK